jgi:hypothetical protein
MAFWKKASMEEKASYDAPKEIVNKKRKIPESMVATAIVPLRPTYGMSTV